MRFLSVNARNDTPVAASGSNLVEQLTHLTKDLAKDAPIVILLHGFRFSPFKAAHCPHSKILSPTRTAHTGRGRSWPAALGLGLDENCAGIGFGWEARGSFWQAFGQADAAGRALARMISILRFLHTGPVRILAHSLGARVALAGFAYLPASAIDRVVLLSAAAFRIDAERAIATPAGRAAEILNCTSQQNQVFDFLLERIMGRAPGSALAYGRPNAASSKHWLDLEMDDPDVLKRLASLGHEVGAPARHMCHWSLYLRDGLFDLYNALLMPALPMPLHSLKPLPFEQGLFGHSARKIKRAALV